MRNQRREEIVATLIVHVGTGTILDVSDDVYLVDTSDELDTENETLVGQYAIKNGVKVSVFLDEVVATVKAMKELNQTLGGINVNPDWDQVETP